jgi:hypothetical protein
MIRPAFGIGVALSCVGVTPVVPTDEPNYIAVDLAGPA